MLQENAELRAGLWVDGGLEHREEDVLQHFAKVGHKVPASENVANIKRQKIRYVNPTVHTVAQRHKDSERTRSWALESSI